MAILKLWAAQMSALDQEPPFRQGRPDGCFAQKAVIKIAAPAQLL
jgi:hypothetical protein